MKQSLVFLFCLFIISSCKPKAKATNKEKFFPALSYIKSQIAQVDTSVFSIRKVVFIDSTRSDTSYIKEKILKQRHLIF